METTHTRVAIATASSVGGLQRYDAEHDFLFQLQYPGRARGKEFREFVTLYKFPLYLGDHVAALGFRPLLVKTKKRVALDFVERLNTNTQGFRVEPTSVDFVALRPRLQLIRGAWFGSIRMPNISSAGVFGHHVDQSEEFQHAESVGELKNLLIELELDGLTHQVMITADGGIVLYHAYQTDEECEEMARRTLIELLHGCIRKVEG